MSLKNTTAAAGMAASNEGATTMSDDRARILNMLAAGKITADEAERLLDALGAPRGAGSASGGSAIKGDPEPLIAALPKYLYVKVASQSGDDVNIKIPIALIRSGLKLTSLIPAQAMEQINSSMSEHGMSIDFSNLKRDDIDDLVNTLRETEINIDGKNGEKVRIYSA
jgi:hypothetical protein